MPRKTPLYGIISRWTVPYALDCASTACRYSIVGTLFTHHLTEMCRLVSRVRIRQPCDKQNSGASCVTDFSRSPEFSRNFGLKVICLFCCIKLMLSYAHHHHHHHLVS